MSHLVLLGFIVCSHNSSSAGWLDVLIVLESSIYALLANSFFVNSTILMQNKTSIDNNRKVLHVHVHRPPQSCINCPNTLAWVFVPFFPKVSVSVYPD